MLLKCPKCGEELKVYGEPQMQATPVADTDKDSKFPVKLVCSMITVYFCEKCPVKASYTDNREYVPTGECVGCESDSCSSCKKEETEPCPNANGEGVVCNDGHACDACPRNEENLCGEEETE